MLRSRRWVLFAAAISAGGCCKAADGKGGSTLVAETGIPQVPAQINFGNVAVGQSLQAQLPLVNGGSAVLDITKQAVSGPPFSLPTPLQVTSVLPGANTHAVVAFAPTQAGPASGTITLTDDGDPTSVTVALIGVGLDLSVSAVPTSLNFGTVPVGSTAPTQNVTFTNTSSSTLFIAVATGGTAPEYAVTDPQGKAVAGAPVSLATNASYVVTVAFTPDMASIFNSTFPFTICQTAATSACLAPQLISLTGQGATSQLVFSPNPIVFSGIPDGTSSTQIVTISNAGSAAATGLCVYLESQGPSACSQSSSVFTLGPPSVSLPTTLAPAGSLTMPLVFASSGSAAETDVLAVSYTTVGSTTPLLTATDPIQGSESPSPCGLALAPSSLNFNTVSMGTPITESVTLTNTGGTTCSVTGIAIARSSDPSYSLEAGQPLTLSVPPNGSQTIGVTVNLNSNAPPLTRRGDLDFQSNDPSQASVQVPLLASIATPYAGNGAWPWHHDNIQNGLTASDTSWLTGKVAWTYPVSVPPLNNYSHAPSDYLNSPVVGSDGTVYQLGMNGTLYAINPDGGAQWTTPLEGPIIDPHPGTPIIESDGNLFVAFGDTTIDSLNNGLYHVSSTGAVLSAIPPEGDGDGFDLPPMLTNGGLLLGADEVAGAFAFTINANGTFAVADTAAVRADYDQLSAVVGANDATYWCGGGLCTAVSPPPAFGIVSGWPITPGNTTSSTSDLALDEINTGNLMILMGGWSVDVGSGSQQLISVNPATGATVWSLTLPPASAAQQNPIYIGFADATTGNSCPAIGSDGTVYVGNFDGLHAVDGTTGKETIAGFPFPTSSDVLTAPAIGGDGTIFIGTADGTFYAVNPNGTQRFKLTAGGRIAGSPAIGPSGAVYFTADDGFLYAVN
jgi:outer membrane protein assembly factor BamB